MTVPPITPSTLAELRAAIAEIQARDLHATAIDELKELLKPVFKGWQLSAPVFEPGVPVFRGRLLDTPPPSLSDMAYPPATRVRRDGRVNRAGSTIFYGSAAREAVFFELGATPGTKLAIAHYEATAKLPLMRVGYTAATFNSLRSARAVPPYGEIDVAGYTDQEKLVNDLLSDAFTVLVAPADEWKYRLSVAIAEKLLDAHMTEGLLYPTVAMAANADNLALRPRFVDKHLRPMFAEFGEVTAVRGSKIDYTMLDEARRFQPNGAIQWLGHLGQWSVPNQGSLKFEAKSGYWVARDQAGNIVDPT